MQVNPTAPRSNEQAFKQARALALAQVGGTERADRLRVTLLSKELAAEHLRFNECIDGSLADGLESAVAQKSQEP